MERKYDITRNRHWLAFANANRCNHYKALKDAGFVSWQKERNNFKIGDIVYFFSSKERRIIFKTQVVCIEMRSDCQFWVETPPIQLTWRLEAVQEYEGNELNEESLMKHGFKGGKSLQHPMCNNDELFSYIEAQFDM